MNARAASLPASPLAADQGALALCLSGGGLRATLFHLGLIRALRQATLNGRMALEAVREVYSVSGGSILAAHFLVNYPRYLGDEGQFREVETELMAFANRDLRNRVIRRWPFLALAENPRGRLLEKEYHRFLRRLTIGQCYAQSADIPTFHFLCTSFTSGSLCSFSRTCFEQLDPRGESDTEFTPADGIPLAFAVAASSAFPPMFPPMTLTPEALGTAGKAPFNSPIALSDGGVFDNFGIDKLRQARREGVRPGLVIVSNAGGSFATDPDHSYTGMLSRNIRASDILMRRVADNTLGNGQSFAGSGLILVRIGATLPDPDVAETTQLRFHMVRTDLDRFDPELAGLLIGHGERVARQALSDHRWGEDASATFAVGPRSTSDFGGGDAASAERTASLNRRLSAAARSSWLSLIFDVRDFFVLALWWAIAGLVVGSLIFAGFSYQAAQRAKADEIERRLQESDINGETLERVRQAAEKGDMPEIRKTLAIAIETNQDLARQASAAEPSVPATVSPGQVEEILKTPDIRPLPKVGYPNKVYIHFAGSLTRAQITALNRALEAAGWTMPEASGERLPAAAGKGEVRYTGNNEAAAQALADALNQSGLSIRRVSPRPNPDVGDNLEIWISG
jgi:predicted acylesterase/phospholipase RssA